MTSEHVLQSEVYEMAASTLAIYTIGSGMTIQRNQPAVQIAARYTIPFLNNNAFCTWLAHSFIDKGLVKEVHW